MVLPLILLAFVVWLITQNRLQTYVQFATVRGNSPATSSANSAPETPRQQYDSTQQAIDTVFANG